MKTNRLLVALVLLGALLLTGCDSNARVGALQNESQSVELGDAESVLVEITFGAGNLELTGSAEKLLEADFTYNVAMLKPEVEYKDGTLFVSQPDSKGFPALAGITSFRNDWDLRLSNDVPMDLIVNIGSGTSDLQLFGLSLIRLDVTIGAGQSTIDLTGDWTHNLAATIDAGAASTTVRLPSDVGVRVEVDRGPSIINAPGLVKNGNVYTNAAYGVSEVTIQINMEAGIGLVNLELEAEATASD